MKEYKKVELLAKNAPTGSYSAGCPAQDRGDWGGQYSCINCERTR